MRLIGAGLAIAGATLAIAAGAVIAQGRPLSVVSWGGAYQDAQKEVYFKPFIEKTGVKMVDESWDGGIGVSRPPAGLSVNWKALKIGWMRA